MHRDDYFYPLTYLQYINIEVILAINHEFHATTETKVIRCFA